jgi:hypothetical protein
MNIGILAMDVFGHLSSKAEFTISEGFLFICKELKHPSTTGSLLKVLFWGGCGDFILFFRKEY